MFDTSAFIRREASEQARANWLVRWLAEYFGRLTVNICSRA